MVSSKAAFYHEMKNKRSASLGKHTVFHLGQGLKVEKSENMPKTPRLKQTRKYRNKESSSESEVEEVKEARPAF